MNNHLPRFLVVMSLVALGATRSPLVARQASQSAQFGSPSTWVVSTSGQTSPGAVGLAYSADEVRVTTQTLADGTTLTHRSLTRAYRDSQGRMRRETYKSGVETVGEGVSPEFIQIIDPVAGVYYHLNPRDLTAQRTEMFRRTVAPRSNPAGEPAKPTQTPQPQISREDLGTQVIEGLEAKGERITRTIPEGEQGNDRPMHLINEFWRSVATPPIVLMTTTKDPQRGETVMHLTNLVLEEPPAELFQVPPDYTVKELEPVTKPESPSE